MAEWTTGVRVTCRSLRNRGGVPERLTGAWTFDVRPATFVLVTMVLLAGLSEGCARHRHVVSVPVRPAPEEVQTDAIPRLWPVDPAARKITSEFGEKRSGGRLHKGLDIAVPRGTPVVAAASGITSFSGEQGGYGKIVIVDHCNGYETAYAHLDEILTSHGARIRCGTKIGLAGATGNATGPHLHYEVRCNRNCVNPEHFLH